MKPQLYQYAACPFCNKVRSVLEYKGVDFETIEVHPLKKTEIAFSPDYQAVPIYKDREGKQINDSTPIMRYIDREFPEPSIFRNDTREEEWLGWSEKLVKGLPVVIYDTLPNALNSFNYITTAGKFGWLERRMIKYSGAFVMTMVAKKIRKREQIEKPENFLPEKTAEWAQGLNGKPFMGGERPNAADFAVYGILRPVEGLKAGKQLKENPVFAAWHNRMRNLSKKSPEPAKV